MVSALFDRIAARHGGIVCEHWTVAAAAARLVSEPERFDVIVAPASGAHVLATIAQETASAVGVAHAAHFGPACAVFEGSHGPVHALTGKDRANPSALILAGATMLDHIGQHDVAVRVRNAWLRTIEDGIRTFDMNADDSGDEVGTAAFSGAVIDRLGQEPILLASAHTRRHATLYALPDVSPATSKAAGEPRQRVGADLVVDAPGLSPDAVVSRLHACEGEQFRLTKLHSRAGSSAGFGERAGQHGWSCRYMARLGTVLDARAVAALEMRVAEQGLECVETRHLFSFAGAAGFSAASSS
jgi:isocitrate dehydrogenase